MSEDGDAEEHYPLAGKQPMIRPSKRGLAYSSEDASDSSSVSSSSEEPPRPRLSLSISWSPKRSKVDESPVEQASIVESSNSDEYLIGLATRDPSPPVFSPCTPPPRMRTIIHYSITKEIYFETRVIWIRPPKPVIQHVPLFKHVLEFVKGSKFAITFFDKLLRPHLASRDFLKLRRVCKDFNRLIGRIYESRTRSNKFFESYYKPPCNEEYLPLYNYTYRLIYRQMLTTYSNEEMKESDKVDKRKTPPPITIPLQGTMETFSKSDRVIEAIRKVFASNTPAQRKELKKLLDVPLAVIQAQNLVMETMKNYRNVNYKSNFTSQNWCFVSHLEAKLFILLQCPRLIDLPNADQEIISSTVMVKTIVKEIHNVLLGLESAASNHDYVAKLISYLTGTKVIKQLLVLTACFRGGIRSTWVDLTEKFRDRILRGCCAKNRLGTLSCTDYHDDWEHLGKGGVVVRTCQELLSIKVVGGEARGSAIYTIKAL